MNARAQVSELKHIKAFLLDMDGTLYLGDQPLPGANAFLTYLDAVDLPFFCLTNNSSKAAQDYLEKFNRLGYPVTLEQIITSGQLTATSLGRRYPDASVYIVGTPSLVDEFRVAGFRLDDDQPELVVVGFDTGFTYEKLSRLCTFVRQGLPYFATHPDFNCPTETGPIPDIGATLAFVQASTGRNPDEVFGKPSPALASAILEKTNMPSADVCMVGDRLYTDIAMSRHGLKTILVLSGESKREDLQDSLDQPDWIFEDVGQLLGALEASRLGV